MMGFVTFIVHLCLQFNVTKEIDKNMKNLLAELI